MIAEKKQIMNVEQAYNLWASQYDSNQNKTRDLEAIALRETLSHLAFDNCLEIGCGTGKNTEWLVTKSTHVTAVDLSEEMLSIAKEKLVSRDVTFIRADINEAWHFPEKRYDLVTFSLVLEHIENLDGIFGNVSKVVSKNGHVYIGELHPFKQYAGTKARFDTEEGRQEVLCFNHHISDFVNTAKKYGLEIEQLKEYFDNEAREGFPRILTLLLQNGSGR